MGGPVYDSTNLDELKEKAGKVTPEAPNLEAPKPEAPNLPAPGTEETVVEEIKPE
jgi:hypothetical protein